jgi:tetratricopeptide (TPR) repeat protein
MNYKGNNYRILAEKLYLEGNLSKSADLYKKSLEESRDIHSKVLMLFNLGVVYTELGDWNNAIEYYKDLIKLDSKYSDAYYQLGTLYEDLEKLEDACDYYKKALEINDQDSLSLYNLANILDKQGNIEEAISIYYKIIKIDPLHSSTLNNLGAIHEQREEYSLALDFLIKSIEIDPNYYLSHFNIGVVYFALGDIEKSVYHYNIAKELKSDYEYIYLNLSAICIDKKEYQKAVDILSEGIRYNERAYDLYYNRACSYSIMNNHEKALDDIEISLSLYPSLIKWVVWDDDLLILRDKDRYAEIVKNYS